MGDVEGFAHELGLDEASTELDDAIATGWFLAESAGNNSIEFDRIVEFLRDWGIRTNINKSRLKTKLRAAKTISFQNGETVSYPIKARAQFNAKYGEFLGEKPPEVSDTILEAEDFSSARRYVQNLVHQVNGSRQFHFYDACAVMMRRLAEVLIIDAYEAKGARGSISSDGSYKMMSGLISELKSGKNFRLSRNAPKWLDQLKELGDNAAHSRTYITKKLDIDDFAANFRKLIAELQSLQPS